MPLTLFGSLFGFTSSVMADTIKLRIIENTNIHANVMDYDYYKGKPSLKIGLARAANLVKKARTEVENSVLVDVWNPLPLCQSKLSGVKLSLRVPTC